MMTKRRRIIATGRPPLFLMLAVLFILLPGDYQAKAEDTIAPETSGEFTFGSENKPIIKVEPVDPSFQRRLDAAARRKAESEQTLRQLNDALVVSSEKQTELEEDVAALNKDRKTLVDQLITTARSIQTLEDEVADSERRLTGLGQDEARIQRSLVKRRAVLSEVLAALQRMGQNPPPAIFVSADDVLSSVRGAILLGSVLPELRFETEVLLQDIDDLRSILVATRLERKQRIRQETVLSEEQVRLDLLIKENQKLKLTSGKTLKTEREQSEVLTNDATNLRELISSLGVEIETVSTQALKAKTAAERDISKQRATYEANRQQELAALEELRNIKPPQPESERDSVSEAAVTSYVGQNNIDLPLRDKARTVVDYTGILEDTTLRVKVGSFVKKRGVLPFPARGVMVREFGDPDGLGGRAEGITFQTRAEARVVTPAAGRVLFAGAFSGFEKLLIIDVGGGYHMVLAGMDKVDVRLGDFLAAGEPVGVMGNKRVAHLAGLPLDALASLDNNFSASQTHPLLYVELRKNSRSINSAPWWAKS